MRKILPTNDPLTEVFVQSDGTEVEFTRSCGNIFADLGLPDAEELLFKTKLISEVLHAITERGLSQRATAEITGLSQPRISLMMRGKFDSITTDMLFKMLNRLGHGVEVRVAATPRKDAQTIVVSKRGRRAAANGPKGTSTRRPVRGTKEGELVKLGAARPGKVSASN